jgi:hypothetical protein
VETAVTSSRTTFGIVAIGGSLISASLIALAVGLASPASADLVLDGDYTRTFIDGAGFVPTGLTDVVTFTSCGFACIHWQLQGAPSGFDMYLDRHQWVAVTGAVTTRIDILTMQGSSTTSRGTHTTFVLSKNP